MGDGSILRIFAFRPARSDSAFDSTVRDDVLPGLLAMSRHAHRLVAGEVDAREMLPNTLRPPLRAREGARAGAPAASGTAGAAGAAK